MKDRLYCRNTTCWLHTELQIKQQKDRNGGPKSADMHLHAILNSMTYELDVTDQAIEPSERDFHLSCMPFRTYSWKIQRQKIEDTNQIIERIEVRRT